MIPSPDDVISAFWQQGESDCTTIATIKTAIATYGLDGIFNARDNGDQTWGITFRDGALLAISDQDIASMKSLAGFTLAPNASQTQQDIFNYALFCFGVFVARYSAINNCSLQSAAQWIDGGINVAQEVANASYRYLGIPDNTATPLVPLQSNGLGDPATLANNGAYLMWNVYHAVFASGRVFDDYGEPLDVVQFVAKHHKLWKGKTVWALKFL